MRFFWRCCLGIILVRMIFLCYTLKIDHPKKAPEFVGVASEVVPYVNEWLSLAKEKGLVFHHEITVGFKDIKEDKVIGQCNYGSYFREIDLNKAYWNKLSKMTKMILLFHELSHCYCNRRHDFNDGEKYDESEDRKYSREEGFFSDGCPISIMHPFIMEDDCAMSHYSEYVQEMLQRCKEY